jgi:hypothetical protein
MTIKFKFLIFSFAFLSLAFASTTGDLIKPKPKFKILAISENGGHHIEYSKAAKVWLDKLAADNNFIVDYIHNTSPIDEKFLDQYQLFIQLDFPPYTWS